MDRLIVTHIRNPFDPWNSRVIEEMPAGLTVAECLQRLPAPVEGYGQIIAVDGLLLSKAADHHRCRPVSSLVVCAEPQGGGGKNPLATVAMLAVMVAAFTYAAPLGAWLNKAVFAGALSAQTATGMAMAGMMAVGGTLVGALLPPPTADLTGGQADFSQSATYGWEVAHNSDRENVPWPVLYGTHRISPPLIGKYVEAIGDRQYLNLLYAVADHAIDSIDEESIEIDGNPVTRGEGIDWQIRLGAADQSVIQYFHDTRATKSVNMKLSVEWITIQTDGNAVEGVAIALRLPRGLYCTTDTSGVSQASVKVDLEIGAGGVWTRLQGHNETAITVVEPRWSAGYWLGPEWHELEAGSALPGDHLDGAPYTGAATRPWSWSWGGDDDRVSYIWRWVTAESIREPGTVATDYVEIAAAQTSALRRVYYRDRIPAGRYEVRARLHEAPPAGIRYANEVWLDYVEEIVYDDFTYPGTALFALRALATDRLSGGLPRLSLVATRATVPVWTGSGYEQRPADLSAWQAWDMLHNGDYGGGAGHERLPVAPFQEWADYCTAKGYHSHVYFDSIVNLRKALDIAGTIGEGVVAQIGGAYTCYVDREEELPVQSFMFSDANVIRDSYTETYASRDDRANAVEVTFWDAANGHRRTTLEIPAADYDATTEEIRRTQLNLIGCTSRAEAIKHGYRALNRNRHLTLVSTWEAGFDAIGCLPWDPVVAPLGRGGRVLSATAASVTIDQSVLLQPGRTQLLRIKHALDDRVEEAVVAAVTAETITDTLAIDGTFAQTPQCGELYMLYEQGEEVRLMRVLSITRQGDRSRKITAIEYSAAACDDTGALPAPETAANPHWVEHLRAVEVWKGGAETRAQLSWTGFAILWRIWYRRTTPGEAWIPAGSTAVPSYEIRGLDYGPEYQFAVSHTRNPDDGKSATLVLSGKTTPPGDVGAITATPREDGVTFAWPAVAEFDLAGYRVRSGVHWQADAYYIVQDFHVVPTDGSARRYRCVTPGRSGATEPLWPEAGTVADGDVVWQADTADWPWEAIASPSAVRDLGDAEKAQQGRDSLTVRIWVVAEDAFGNVSQNVATGSGSCLNQKPSITVGISVQEGTFTALDQAVAKLPSGGGKILIRNGEYLLPPNHPLPNRNLILEGETQAGVRLLAAPNANGLYIDHFTGQLTLSNLTLKSQANQQWRWLVSCGPNNQAAKLSFDDVLFDGLQGNANAIRYDDQGAGSIAIRGGRYLGSGSFLNGLSSGTPHSTILVDGVTIIGAVDAILVGGKDVSVINNALSNLAGSGIQAGMASAKKVVVSRNIVAYLENVQIASLKAALAVLGEKTECSGNAVDFRSNLPGSHVIGILLESLTGEAIARDNKLSLATSNCETTGIKLGTGANHAAILYNTIRISDAASYWTKRGIYLTNQASRNVLTGNAIDMGATGSNGQTIGIDIMWQCKHNQGGHNIITNATTEIVNGGPLDGNTVNQLANVTNIDGGAW